MSIRKQNSEGWYSVVVVVGSVLRGVVVVGSVVVVVVAASVVAAACSVLELAGVERTAAAVVVAGAVGPAVEEGHTAGPAALLQLGDEVEVLAQVDVGVHEVQASPPAEDVREAIAIGPLPDIRVGLVLAVGQTPGDGVAEGKLAGSLLENEPTGQLDHLQSLVLQQRSHGADVRRRVKIVIVEVSDELPRRKVCSDVALQADAPVLADGPVKAHVNDPWVLAGKL
mmetsp:Transcript_36211/g.100534  ORF Transcript_36211/g.100534 Transcript_36211/m.100534 type:complete len:226 (+) Transcript_36211:768-1445(+)